MENFDERLKRAVSDIGMAGIQLKKEQKEAICHVMNGKDVFVWLPTGFGKSLCYEVLPFIHESPTCIVLVVSPLLSLMVNQVESLLKRGVSAFILTTSRNDIVPKEFIASSNHDAADYMSARFLFGATEAYANSKWRDIITSASINDRIVAVAIDEAHCVSKSYGF